MKLTTLAVIVVWIAAVYIFEFRLREFPTVAQMKADQNTVVDSVYGLHDVAFECAQTSAFVTSLSLVKASESYSLSDAKCEPRLEVETTRCQTEFPMRSFSNLIACAKPEEIGCAEAAPLQRVGLFEGDSLCGTASEQDLGAPAPQALRGPKLLEDKSSR